MPVLLKKCADGRKQERRADLALHVSFLDVDWKVGSRNNSRVQLTEALTYQEHSLILDGHHPKVLFAQQSVPLRGLSSERRLYIIFDSVEIRRTQIFTPCYCVISKTDAVKPMTSSSNCITDVMGEGLERMACICKVEEIV